MGGGVGGRGRVGGGGVGGRGRVGGVKVDVIEELKFLGKFTKKKLGRGVGGGSGWWGGLDGCERRIEVYVKIQKKKWGGGGGVVLGGGGVGLVGGGGGVRVDVNEELKFL